jgi:hypothetical protein
MKPLSIVTALLLGAGTVGLPMMAIAQDPPASTYQPGFWQPAARIQINRPITVEIANKTDIAIDFNLTTNQVAPQVQIASGKSEIIKDFALPVYLLINPDPLKDSTQFVLKYDLEVNEKNNTLVVNVRKMDTDGNPGSRALNIDNTGAIYIY